MIPRLIHLWWHDSSIPPDVARALIAWKRHHPGWDVQCWSDEDELSPVLELAELADVHENDRHRHASNLVRWHLLRAHGGIWVDADTTPVNGVEPLTDLDAPFAPAAGIWLSPFVVGGPAGHELWAAAADAGRVGRGPSPAASGGRMLTAVARDHLDLVRYPLASFTRTDAAGRRLALPPGAVRYSDHAWATSRARRSDR